MKDPAFLFYPGDWMGGTQWMTFEQKGCYIELLILQFNTGKFTEAQAKQVLSICFDVAWPMLKQKFVSDGGMYWNERLKVEIEKRKTFTESRRINGLGKKTTDKHMLKHMENENENKNVSYLSIYNTIKSSNEIEIPKGFEPLIIEWLKYKSEKGQSYKPTGLKSFIKTYISESGQNLTVAKEMLQNSMSKNYAGLFPIKKQNGQQQPEPIKQTSSPYWDLLKPEYR